MNLVRIYYDISEIMQDDIEIVADAIKELTHTKQKRSNIIDHLEYLRLHNIESELNQLYDMQKKTLRAFYIEKSMCGKQTTIRDNM